MYLVLLHSSSVCINRLPSILDMRSLRFHAADYAVFGLTLVFSIAIGIYHAVISKPSTTKEYLLASRKMMSVPVALSLLASFMSGITILGVPSEIYTFGIQYWLVIASYILLFPSVALIFVPTLYELDLTSSYEVLVKYFCSGNWSHSNALPYALGNRTIHKETFSESLKHKTFQILQFQFQIRQGLKFALVLQ